MGTRQHRLVRERVRLFVSEEGSQATMGRSDTSKFGFGSRSSFAVAHICEQGVSSLERPLFTGTGGIVSQEPSNRPLIKFNKLQTRNRLTGHLL